MLKLPVPTRARRVAGRAALGAIVLAGSFAVYAAQSAPAAHHPSAAAVSEAFALFDGAKAAVADYGSHHGYDLPADNAAARLPAASLIAGKYVAGVRLADGRLDATLRDSAGGGHVVLVAMPDKIIEVETRSGWSDRFDAAASNADVVSTYDLVEGARGRTMAGRLRRRRFSPSLFVVHFGTEGSWPDLPHHSILFGPRYQGLLTDIYRGSGLPADPSLYLHHPTATDASRSATGRANVRCRRRVFTCGRRLLAVGAWWRNVGTMTIDLSCVR